MIAAPEITFGNGTRSSQVPVTNCTVINAGQIQRSGKNCERETPPVSVVDLRCGSEIAFRLIDTGPRTGHIRALLVGKQCENDAYPGTTKCVGPFRSVESFGLDTGLVLLNEYVLRGAEASECKIYLDCEQGGAILCPVRHFATSERM